MDLEARMSRREFIPLLGGLVAGLTLAGCELGKDQVEDLRYSLRRSAAVRMDMYPEIEIKESITREPFPKETLEQMTRELMKAGIGVKNPRLVDSYQATWFRAEPDTRYSSLLISQAQDAINHAFGYLGFKKSEIPPFRLEVPSKESDISIWSDGLYIISDFGIKEVFVYEAERDGRKEEFKVNRAGSLVGRAYAHLEKAGFGESLRFKSKNGAIFYNSSKGFVEIIAVPVVEMLHRYFMDFTFDHTLTEAKGRGLTRNEINEVSNKNILREEVFVHALGFAWLKQYNKDRKLGVTDQEFNQVFLDESSQRFNEKYTGLGRMERHIEQIGVRRAIEIYKSNPNELFKGAGLQ